MNDSMMVITTYRTRAFAAALVGILSFAALCNEALAQAPGLDPETSGRSYLIAFPDTVSNVLDLGYPNTRVNAEFSVWIYSAVTNRVQITQGDGAVTTLDIPAGEFAIHTFTGSPVVANINAPSGNTHRIEAQFPIILYCYLITIQSCEVWTPIPIDRWGKEYHSANVPGEIVRDIGRAQTTLVPHTPKMGPAEILILAAHDDTHITLRPPAGVDFLEGAPRAITLDAGQAYQVQSFVNIDEAEEVQQDIAATVITSDKPIGVLSGNTRAQYNNYDIGLKNNAYKNMLMEWLAPVEQHGTEFVFMPTWDSVRMGNGAAAERKREQVRLYSAQGRSIAGYYLQQNDTTRISFSIPIDTLHEFAFGAPAAVHFRTEAPSQAMMHSSAIVKFNGATPCFGGVPCLSYDAWAPYMVELTPREQWGTFAPYYAPPSPSGMGHYLNVVADTVAARSIYREDGTLFPFTRKIPGTDLIWGSATVEPGRNHHLEGRNGARFFAFAYGMFKGFEEYRPVERAEFEEYNALAYGYPLAPRRTFLSPVQGVEESGRRLRDLEASVPATVGEAIRIRYAVDAREHVRIDIHDGLGRQVRSLIDGNVEAGEHLIEWNASRHASGIYYCRMTIGPWSRTIPIVVRR